MLLTTFVGVQHCPGNSFFQGFRLRVDDSQNSHSDNVGVTNVEFICQPGSTTLHGDGHDYWENWTQWHTCPPKTRICGVRTKTTPGYYTDDAGVTDIMFKCCMVE